ncbi:MAG: hypothetical protein DRI57_25555, partial [Deltaproteobacteria bacterium]
MNIQDNIKLRMCQEKLEKAPVNSVYCRLSSIKKHSFMILVIILFWGITSAGSSNGMGSETIVLDPGHGGADHGVRGADGTSEKTVTLI